MSAGPRIYKGVTPPRRRLPRWTEAYSIRPDDGRPPVGVWAGTLAGWKSCQSRSGLDGIEVLVDLDCGYRVGVRLWLEPEKARQKTYAILRDTFGVESLTKRRPNLRDRIDEHARCLVSISDWQPPGSNRTIRVADFAGPLPPPRAQPFDEEDLPF